MKRFCLGLTAVLLSGAPAWAGGERNDCGGDAYSFAEVVPAERGVRAGGPVIALPESLCADLAGRPDYRNGSLSIYVDGRAGASQQPDVRGEPSSRVPYRRH